MFRGPVGESPLNGVGQPGLFLSQGAPETDLLLHTATIMPVISGTPEAVPAMEDIPTIHPDDAPPPEGTLAVRLRDMIWAKAMTKAGIIESRSGGKGSVKLGGVAGVYVHEAFFAGMHLSPDEQAERDDELHADLPPLFRSWIDAATAVIPEVEKLVAPEPGKASVRAGETPIYLGTGSRASMSTIQKELIAEQLRLDGRPGPIAYILRAYYSTADNRDARIKAALAMLPEESTISKDALLEHLDNARTHVLYPSEQGHTYARLTVRPDLIDFQFEQSDLQARSAGTALVEVLKAGAGFDLEKLHELKVPYIEYDEHGDALETMIDAPMAIRLAVDQMLAGNLEARYFDYKVQSETSEDWRRGLNQAWALSDFNLETMFADDKVYGNDPEFTAQRKYWMGSKGIVKNLTGGVRALAEFFEFGYRESLRNEGEDIRKAPSWEQISEYTRAIAVLVYFDVYNGCISVPDQAPDQVRYQTSPPSFLAGVPDDIPMHAKEVPRDLLRQSLLRYGEKVRSDVIIPYAGKVALAARMSKEA